MSLKALALIAYLLVDVGVMYAIVKRKKLTHDLLVAYLAEKKASPIELLGRSMRLQFVRQLRAEAASLPEIQQKRLAAVRRLAVVIAVLLVVVIGFPLVAYRIL
jgi:primosomal protein N''